MKAAVYLIAVMLIHGTAYAGGGGSGWTQCYVKDLGLKYSFSGYTQSLKVGKEVNVFSTTSDEQLYGKYQIDSIDLSSDVGVIELSHLPTVDPSITYKNINFGNLKVEYFSNSALKDIKVTLDLDGDSKSGSASCFTD